MADLQEVQKTNAEQIVAQYLLVRKRLRKDLNDDQLGGVAATLTAALWSSDAGATANGLTDGKVKHLATHTGVKPFNV